MAASPLNPSAPTSHHSASAKAQAATAAQRECRAAFKVCEIAPSVLTWERQSGHFVDAVHSYFMHGLNFSSWDDPK